jgi:hypothetical protein
MVDSTRSTAVSRREELPVLPAGGAAELLRRAALAARQPLVALALIYAAVRVLAFLEVDPRGFPDTGVYERVAAAPLLSEGFLAGGRPPTVPLAYKLLGGEEARVAGQLVLSIACWTWLAAATAAALRTPWLRVAGFAAVLGLSLSHEIQLWDAALLSESIALSLTAALAASWLQLIRRPTAGGVAVMLAVSALWALSRDPNAYLLIAVAAVLAASLPALEGRRGLRGMAAAGLVMIAAGSVFSAGAGYPRWLYPVQNLVALRISADPEGLEHFERAGMPVSDRFLELSERQRLTGVRPFAHPGELHYSPGNEAEFMPFQLWLAEHGRGAYGGYLLTHPGAVLDGVGPALTALADPRVDRYAANVGPAEAPVLSGLAFTGGVWPMALWLAVALGLAVAVAARGGARREWALPGFMLAAAAPFALFVYHAGAQELDRHMLVPSLLLRLGALLLIMMALDALVARRAGGDGPATGPSAALCR